MGNISVFSAASTKARIMEGKMLKKEQYERLIESRDYLEALHYLKEETSYVEILKKYNIEELHRGQLENILRRYYIDIFYKLSHYFGGEYKILFKILFIKYQIEDLKIIFRAKYNKDSIKLESNLATENCPMNHIDYKKLESAKDIEGIVDMLKETRYYKNICPLAKTINEEGLFRLEMALDFEYFSAIKKFKIRLDSENMSIIKRIYGEYCDLLNIQWIFRGKKYYNLKPEILINYTIFERHKLDSEIIKNLCFSKSIDEFFEIISKLPYSKVFNNVIDKEHLVEREMMLYMKSLYKKFKREGSTNIGGVIAYLELLNLEIKDIISIVENKRYGGVNEEITKYITAEI